MTLYENEEGYIELLKDIIDIDNNTPDRTKCGTKKLFGATLVFPDIEKGFPVLTARPVPMHLSIREILFFLSGKVQTKELEAQGVNFWKKHTSREFLDKRGLTMLPEGHMGYAYGAVMRHAGGTYDENYNPIGGFDQLTYVINELQKDIWSRRAMIELWSPQDLDRMALTPCCHNYNFCATMGEDGEPELNLAIKIRSSDVAFGLGGANACQFGFLLLAVAQLLKVRAKKLTLILIDSHVYSGGYANQVPYLKEAVKRDINPLPQLKINKEINTVDDLTSIRIEDLELVNYFPNTTPMKEPRPPMAV